MPPLPIKPGGLKSAPISYSQERLWLMHQIDPGLRAYNQIYLYRLSGRVSIPALEQALNEILRRHEALRTAIAVENGEPHQVVVPYAPMSLPVVDFSDFPEEEREAKALKFADDEGYKPFDLKRAPLLRIRLLVMGEKRHFLLFNVHHIAFDGWSARIFSTELEHFYKAFLEERAPTLAEPPVQYTDYAIWQREWMAGEVLDKHLAYWKKQLAGELPALDLPLDRPRPPVRKYAGARISALLDPALEDSLRAFCQRERITPFMLLLAAFDVLLFRYTGQEDMIVACPFANRPRPELENLVGYFVNTLPLRTDLSGNPTFRELLARVRKLTLEAFAFQALPLDRLVTEINPDRDPHRSTIFQVQINMHNFPMGKQRPEGSLLTELVVEDPAAPLDLSYEIVDQNDQLRCQFRYDTDLFEEATIRRLLRHYLILLRAALEDPDARVGDLPLLSPEERHQILVEWNNTRTDFPADICVHQLVEAQAVKTPDASAVICDGEQVTYRQLNRRANRLANSLLDRGVGAETLVGIYLPRSINSIVAQLGILKAGGAYLPLDMNYPGERIRFILEEAKPALVITDRSLADGLSLPEEQRLYLEGDLGGGEDGGEENLPCRIEPHNLAYVIYTSGSTGRPKGVMIPHRGLINYLVQMAVTYALREGERILAQSSLSFDASGRSTLGPLTFGGCVVMINDAEMGDPAALLRTVAVHRVTGILSIVPTMLKAMTEMALQTGFCDHNLHLVLVSGEALQAVDARRARQAFGPGVRLFNVYGPTECTMTTTAYPLTGELPKHQMVVPIGRPIANTRVYVLDKNLSPVPIGVKGELHIGGMGVGRGYLNRPDLTAEQFIRDPFNSAEDERLYKTGDLARYMPDGSLEFLGRIDTQVKIRGNRVELGEIESVLSQHPAVREAAVILREDMPSGPHLVAYLTTQTGIEISDNSLREFLSERLPIYMIPMLFITLPALPLTPNRKIDRRALPYPDVLPETAGIPPRTETERSLVEIWKRILGIEKVGVRDDFFALGGHSLMAVSLFTEIEHRFGVRLPLALLMSNGTIEKLAAFLEGRTETITFPVMLALQPDGTKPPLFIAPGIHGVVLYLRDFARNLADDRPVYGFQFADLDAELTRNLRIEDLAARFVAEMRKIQPVGPYRLGGHSFGGYVAIEAARLLFNSGEQVAALILFDTLPPGPRRQASIADRVTLHLDNLRSLKWQERVIYLRARLENMLFKAMWIDQFRKIAQRWGMIASISRQTFKFARYIYTPPPYQGDMILFKVSDRPWYVRWDPMDHWAQFVSGRIETCVVPGGHFDMLAEPNVKEVARLARERLDFNGRS